MNGNDNSYSFFFLAIVVGLIFNVSAIFFTLETTYDALIHLFFADHYANNWFEPWEYRWYTGFTVMGYPPLVHQLIALFSYMGGLKFGLFTVAVICCVLFITGVYRFANLLMANQKIAGYTALLAALSSSFVETLHIFGQLPSIMGISILMHALPEIYQWIKTGRYRYLLTSLSLIAVTVTSHHVTPIFGMVFFIFPLIGMVIMDTARTQVESMQEVTFKVFFKAFLSLFKRIISFGILSLIIIITCILPYWINSKNNPITQVPIPHGSRDNFLEVTSSGLVFFLIPWGILLFLLPYIFYRYYSKRFLFFGLSISMLTLLGTGGTTPLPKIMLGETAFNILTLDRFTLWASIMSLPVFGEFAYRYIEGDLREWIRKKFGSLYHQLLGGALAAVFLFMTVFTISLGYFRPSQPQKIKMLPIINFLNQDEHDKWRYLTLGFGDQMAWLSAQTNALTVDGNYHSARRLPELTTRAIERLENSKFKGIEGIGSLQQFLTVPEKYNLKYIFSNDKFYDPLLYFCGWQRLRQLENGIMVWERLNIPPLSSILPKDEVATPLKLMWGTIPILTLILAFIINIQWIWLQKIQRKSTWQLDYFSFTTSYDKFSSKLVWISKVWAVFITCIVGYGIFHFYLKNEASLTPENVVKAYFDAIDFKEFETAFTLLDPKSELSIEEYMLRISVNDGILSSYAKLEAIEMETLKKQKNTANVKVQTQWITPLERIDKTYLISTVKRDGKWYMLPEDIDTDIPPDQFFIQNTTGFYNHGRRKITTQQTHHEDILKQPVLEVLEARLIRSKDQYVLVGEIQNVDNIPADISLKASLYTNTDKRLATFNAKYHVKHKLLPKEISTFRINFEGIAWSEISDSIPKTFNPEEFTPLSLQGIPEKFDLLVAANVATSDLYKKVTLNNLIVENGMVNGVLFNYGLQEVTIAQLLISYFDKNKKLIKVAHHFLPEGIRPQRKQSFKFSLAAVSDFNIVSEDMSAIYINGLPNDEISKKAVSTRKNQKHHFLQKVDYKEVKYIKIEINSYVGNPI
ncbi:hypothetical protein [Ascidiimonas sp. W6]|uniref:hypothetical protein n=1 Tax=Ascidiimonas meishanensis TaxID=3128903 RepID=UPI0030ED2AC0